MAFPADPLGARVEIQAGDTWTDITSDVYLADGITITRGRRDHGVLTDPGRCSLVLNNGQSKASPGVVGRYSPRNPLSDLYGLIGRNTPIRVSVHTGDPYLYLDGDPATYASTPDHPSLDITGDIDVRIEAATDWQRPGQWTIVGKWGETEGDWSWVLRLTSSVLNFSWSATGVDATTRFAAIPVPGDLQGRAALRVTLDVDNGSGNSTVTFYQADSISGPWTMISQVDTTTGVSSIHASTASLRIAPYYINPAGAERLPIAGRVYRAEVRSGIDGTVVASPDFTAQTPGTLSFTDSAGRPWTLAGNAEITNRQERFYGEVSEWPSSWGVTGKQVRVPVEASGILRRLRQGTKALDSTLRRRIPSDPDLVAYWPMEEGENATQCYSPLEGVPPLAVSGLDFAADDSLPGSGPLPKLGASASLRGSVPLATTQGWQVECVYLLETMPTSQTEILRVQVAGSAMAQAVVYASTSGVRVEARDADDAVLAFINYTTPEALTAFVGAWNRLAIWTTDAGDGDTYLSARWLDVTTGTYWYAFTIYTGDMGAVTGVSGTWGEATNGMAIGHIGVFAVPGTGSQSPGTDIYEQADDGFAGESAIDRMRRLATEEGFPLRVWDGDTSAASEAVGPQRPETTLDLVQAAADADGGILYEQRDTLGLIYRDRTSLYNQAPRLVLDYTAPGEVAPPLEPVDDDEGLVNDVTVRREGGSSARVVLEDGPLSVQDPPDGVGRYDTEITRNLADDAQTVQHAGWLLHLGTWDEARYPTVAVKLHRAPHLIPDLLEVDSGDRIQITNPPAWLPPDTIDLMVQGYSERIGVRTWDWEATCTPAGPWEVGVRDDPDRGRRDTSGSELAAPAGADDTTLYVRTTTGPSWTTDSADLPMDLRVGGEVVTVTAIATALGDAPMAGAGAVDEVGEHDQVAPSVDAAGAADLLVCAWCTYATPVVYTVPAGMTEQAQVQGGFATFLDATEALAGAGATGTRTATADFSDPYSAVSVAVSGSPVIEEHLSDLGSSEGVTLTTAAGTQAGWWLLALHGWDQDTGDEMHTGWEGWELVADTGSDVLSSRITAWAMQVTSEGAQEVVFATGTDVTDVHARLYVLSGVVDLRAQAMTVTRSVNGISKAHAAGTSVRLVRPTVRAL